MRLHRQGYQSPILIQLGALRYCKLVFSSSQFSVTHRGWGLTQVTQLLWSWGQAPLLFKSFFRQIISISVTFYNLCLSIYIFSLYLCPEKSGWGGGFGIKLCGFFPVWGSPELLDLFLFFSSGLCNPFNTASRWFHTRQLFGANTLKPETQRRQQNLAFKLFSLSLPSSSAPHQQHFCEM